MVPSGTLQLSLTCDSFFQKDGSTRLKRGSPTHFNNFQGEFMAQNNSQRQLKNFADNMKKTNLGVTFAKKLFTDPGSLSAKQVTLILKSLGVNIPAEVQATVEVAQIITAGQAVNDAWENGQTINDIKSVTNPGFAAIRALNSIASQNGWIDEDTTSIISYGMNTTMIVASGGLNVAAWIGLAMDVAQTIASKQSEADMRALQDVQNQIQSIMRPQAKILGETFQDFQAGRISIYGLIAKMAVETPAAWPQVITEQSPITQMFPELMMLPTVQKTLIGRGETRIWGDWPWPASGSYVLAEWTSSKSIQYMTLNEMNKEQAAEYFFNILLKPWLTGYAIANDEIVGRGNMSMENVAALSYLVNPSGEISSRDDYVNMLLGANLTPYDFNDPILDDIARKFLEDNYKDVQHSFIEQAISIGQVSANRGFNAYSRDTDIMRRKLEEVQANDSIWELVQYPYIYEKLKSYMDFETVSFEKDPSYGGRINQKFSEQSVTAWRKLHNYIAVIQMLSTFRTDSYLRNTKFAEQLMPFMPSIESFEEKINHLSYLSATRSVNAIALKNIASMLGVKPSQLVKQTKSTDQGPAKFIIKG